MSSKITRRDFVKTTAGLAVGASIGSSVIPAAADAADLSYRPEKGAKLRVLRWKRFVQGDEEQWLANTKKFTQKTGIEVRVDSEGWEDVRPKAAVAANVGAGPDIIIGWYDDPHQYPDKLVDLTELATYLGKKYGGWYDVFPAYAVRNGRWMALPLGVIGNLLVHRVSHVRAAGFDTVPQDLPGFLKLCQAMKAKGTPAGMALGHAVGDGNDWVHWLVWTHGGRLVDEKGNVVINSPETIAALEYAQQLYQTFIPGTLSWQDPHNNKAFLDGQCSLTNNGISIYYAAKLSTDPKIKEMASDIDHADYPIGPVGKKMAFKQVTQAMLFKYSKYPNAAKEYLRFMWEWEQYDPWMQAAIGYVTGPLKIQETSKTWTVDPKHAKFRDESQGVVVNGYAYKLGAASAAAMADYILIDMVAEAASGAQTPKAAAARAEQRALRYYKI
jgi:multiple sugar transport system substrate-binding protein